MAGADLLAEVAGSEPESVVALAGCEVAVTGAVAAATVDATADGTAEPVPEPVLEVADCEVPVAVDGCGAATGCEVPVAGCEAAPDTGGLAWEAALFAAEMAVDAACPAAEDPVPDLP